MKEVEVVHEQIGKLMSKMEPLDGKESIKASEFQPFLDEVYKLSQEWIKLRSKLADME